MSEKRFDLSILIMPPSLGATQAATKIHMYQRGRVSKKEFVIGYLRGGWETPSAKQLLLGTDSESVLD